MEQVGRNKEYLKIKSWDVSNSYKIQIWLLGNTSKTYYKKLKHEINSYIMSCTSQCFSPHKNTFFKVKETIQCRLSYGKNTIFLPQLSSPTNNAIFMSPIIYFLTNLNYYWCIDKNFFFKYLTSIEYPHWFQCKSRSGSGSSILDQCGSG
jgi:hypothetical protein